MHLECVMLSEVNSDRKRKILYTVTYLQNLKQIQNKNQRRNHATLTEKEISGEKRNWINCSKGTNFQL